MKEKYHTCHVWGLLLCVQRRAKGIIRCLISLLVCRGASEVFPRSPEVFVSLQVTIKSLALEHSNIRNDGYVLHSDKPCALKRQLREQAARVGLKDHILLAAR